jgi:hypothetical protein
VVIIVSPECSTVVRQDYYAVFNGVRLNQNPGEVDALPAQPSPFVLGQLGGEVGHDGSTDLRDLDDGDFSSGIPGLKVPAALKRPLSEDDLG